MHFIRSVFLFQKSTDFFNKVWGWRTVRLYVQVQRRGLGAAGFLGGNLAVFQHIVDDQVAALQRLVREIDRRIKNRRFGQSRQQRRFFQPQVFCVLVEVVFGSGFKAIDSMSQKNLVAVESENLLLGEAAFKLQSKKRFLHLAAEMPLRRKKQVARKLHRERGSALRARAGRYVAIGSAKDPPEIDAPVGFKGLIFRGENGVTQHLGKIVIGS